MPSLDYTSFPHLFEAVIDQLILERDHASLRAVYSTSHLAQHIVYEKVGRHQMIDFRVKPTRAGSTVGALWNPAHKFVKARGTVLDIYAGPEKSTYPLLPGFQRMVDAAAPDVVRLMDHYEYYESEDTLSSAKPIDTVVLQAQNWISNDSWNPLDDFWLPLLPPTAKRIVINIRGCAAYGFPVLQFRRNGYDPSAEQEVIILVSHDCTPPADTRVLRGTDDCLKILIESLGEGTFLLLRSQPKSTVLIVDAESSEMSLNRTPLTAQPSPLCLGMHVLSKMCERAMVYSAAGEWRPTFEEVESRCGRVTFDTVERFKDRVGEAMFRLMTEEDVYVGEGF
ncbi:hypothetical protein A1Q2_04515 [Trichosporon asahii var. asahii CBS 8904]|uniref:Uncharacterized protein n=2 Tax=Trichosporon asahii var. asahii TaxID=189963 RepID=K1VP26_TRIAC|nr:hypothetical protein A1Q1_00644 [Trichosporon asahii var. asahii CBS 2479]EJT50177.1 hypothetical protein A1Q1_00644 [Trichosporon asahii var. asahii CBS 2479]EKD01192.1 hypothetical protein A1Q2_04515 [Trichosporon asahii var. asahii CBS 8904]